MRRGRREAGGATVSALVLLALALLVVAGVRVVGGAIDEKLECHGNAVASIGGSGGGGSQCADPGRRTSASLPVGRPADSATGDQWLSRFGRAAGDGFTQAGRDLAGGIGSAWEFGTTPSRWRSAAAWLRGAAARDAAFLASDPLGALWAGVVIDARVARDVWLGIGQWMVDTGAALVSGDPERMGRSAGELGFDGLTAVATSGAGFAARSAVKATVVAGAPRLRFAQTTASAAFSADGIFAGETIGSLAAKLRAGTISVADVPVRYVTIDGNDLIADTRSALALTRAGISQSSWRLIDATATETADIEARLIKNRLTAEGTDVLRITGEGQGTSSLR